jgi:hypothetical protein
VEAAFTLQKLLKDRVGEVCLGGNRDIGSSRDIAVIGKAKPKAPCEGSEQSKNLPRISLMNAD